MRYNHLVSTAELHMFVALFRETHICRIWSDGHMAINGHGHIFVASGHPFAPVIRPTKQNSKKVYLWDTLPLQEQSSIAQGDADVAGAKVDRGQRRRKTVPHQSSTPQKVSTVGYVRGCYLIANKRFSRNIFMSK